jgi:hypothetical protein
MNEDTRRAQAIRRLKVRRDFGWHLATYVIINGFLIFIWSVKAAVSGRSG